MSFAFADIDANDPYGDIAFSCVRMRLSIQIDKNELLALGRRLPQDRQSPAGHIESPLCGQQKTLQWCQTALAPAGPGCAELTGATFAAIGGAGARLNLARSAGKEGHRPTGAGWAATCGI